MNVVELHEPLRLERDPFAVSVAGVHISRPVQAAFAEVMHHIGARTPVILVTGSASTGKTLLVDMIARASAEKGLSIRRVDRGDLLPMALGAPSDVLLIDEANSVADSLLEVFSQQRSKTAATTVFLGLPSCLGRPAFSKLHPVLIELAAFPAADSRSYLLELAKKAGLPNLFTSDALDLIVHGSHGSPRLLRSISSLAYFGAVSDRAAQISSKYATSALGGQVPSAAPKLDTREPGIVRAHEVPVRQRRPTEIPAYIRRATSESLRGLSRDPAPADRKPAQRVNAVETLTDTPKAAEGIEKPARAEAPLVAAMAEQAKGSVQGRMREAETPAQQQSAAEIPTVPQQIQSIEKEADTEATPAEQLNAVEIEADIQPAIESTEEPFREETRQAEHENPTESPADSHVQMAGVEGIVSDEGTPPEDHTQVEANADPDIEGTEELANDPWTLGEDRETLAIPVDSEAPVETIDWPEDTRASAELPALSLSDAQSFEERVWVSTQQEHSMQDQQDVDHVQTAFVSSKPVASRGAMPSNLKYLGIITVCILVAAVAVIALVVPSMLGATDSDLATLPISVPVSQTPVPQTPSIAASPSVILPTPAASPEPSIAQAAPVPQSAIAVAAKETSGVDAAAKSAAPAASDVKRPRVRPLTDEEKAAVARGLQELERAASQSGRRR